MRPLLYILWDASHIWGLMAWRAMRTMGVACRLVKGKEIAEGVLLGKSAGDGASMLLVPGGNARLKSLALGAHGRKAVRDYLARGGSYLGFCGGAGLALSNAAEADGLHICPWRRAVYPERLHHLISGHVKARVAADCGLAPPSALLREGWLRLPVWWPGRFDLPSSAGGDGARVLAAYSAPDKDFWIADLPLVRIPSHVFDAWRDMYGVNLSADFLAGQPLVVSGAYGMGRYVLSYSHLETPHSPDANRWLARLLRVLGGIAPERDHAGAWDLRRPLIVWPRDKASAPLLGALRKSRALLRLATEHHLFFERVPWLWGWRAGLPGAACNSLHAALCTAAGLAPGLAAREYWHAARPQFAKLASLFFAGAEGYLLACRLAATLSPSLPQAVDKQGLAARCVALFGHAMQGGGIVEELLTIVEELIYLSQDEQ